MQLFPFFVLKIQEPGDGLREVHVGAIVKATLTKQARWVIKRSCIYQRLHLRAHLVCILALDVWHVDVLDLDPGLAVAADILRLEECSLIYLHCSH